MDGYGKRVLIVDDNDDTSEILAGLLERAGYNVHFAADGLYALEEMNKRHLDAVISNDRLPRMDGREFLLLSQATWPDTPVIVLSNETDGVERQMIELGAFAWVRTPYDHHVILSVLLSAVRQPLDTHREPAAARMPG